MNNFRLKAASSRSGGALTNTCSMRGRLFSASEPQADGSVGRARKPATCSLSRRNCSVSASRAAWALAVSRFRNTRPAAKIGANAKPAAAAAARKKEVGCLMIRPQPSPVLPSVAIAPRCVRRFNELIAVCKTQWLARSSRLAIKPKPQESLSYATRHRPQSARRGSAPSRLGLKESRTLLVIRAPILKPVLRKNAGSFLKQELKPVLGTQKIKRQVGHRREARLCMELMIPATRLASINAYDRVTSALKLVR